MENNEKQTAAVAAQRQNAVARQGKPVDLLKNMIDAPSVQEQFRNALGENRNAFVASLIDLYTSDKSLQECAPADVVKEALKAATMKLPINRALGFAYIIVFKNNVKNADGSWSKVPTPTFVPGYKGYIQLAMRTGQYKTINADMVYEGELKDCNKLTGMIDLSGRRTSDKIVGYFCYFELLNGCSKTLYMSVEQMAAYALTYSPSFKGKNKPSMEELIKVAQNNMPSQTVGWSGNFNDMALKTVIRRLLSKYGYLSVEMMNAVAADSEIGSASASPAPETEEQHIDVSDAEYESVSEEESPEY